jgi:hypothetical protein
MWISSFPNSHSSTAKTKQQQQQKTQKPNLKMGKGLK